MPERASVTLVRGKGDFVVRKLSTGGGIEKICECEWNADFAGTGVAIAGCISQVRGDLLPEVVANNGRYSPGNLKRYTALGITNNRCEYCYALRYNGGAVSPKVVTERTERDFITKFPKIVRLGKRAEAGHAYYVPTLIDFVNLSNRHGARIVLPTKSLAFGKEGGGKRFLTDKLPSGKFLAQLFRECRAVINYSISNDNLERGVVSQGYDNSWRIEQARLYFNEGVNTTLTLTCDVTSSIEDNDKMGFAVKRAISASQDFGIPLRLLPLRLTRRKLANLLGLNWDDLIYSRPKNTTARVIPGFEEVYRKMMEERDRRPYLRRRNNEAIPRFFHSDFQKLVDSGIGVCGQVGECEHCDKCNLWQERIRFPASEILKIKYNKQHSNRRIDRRRKWEKRQGKLPF